LGDNQRDLTAAMALVAAGDREAFRVLYARTASKLFASIRRILRSQAAAEDALQEAYVRVWRQAGDFDPSIASPVAWMTTIARHAAIDLARRGAERIAAASDDIDADFAGRVAAPASESDPLAATRLAVCLERLEADKRAMVVLAYCHGWSRDELAERYARPVATVKTVLRRSLLALKECLGGRD
jgi:RNA polymerase sigma-70 factor (ECF subfamily)